jgi:PAS domain S-box-containing protein
MSISTNFLSSTDSYLAHGYCYRWQPELIQLHAISDSFIGCSYLSIAGLMLYLIIKREDLPFRSFLLLLVTIVATCGITHLLNVLTLWYPYYWLSGTAKAIAAIVAVITTIQFLPILPKILALTSPRQLEEINITLQREIRERQHIEKFLHLVIDNIPQYIFWKDINSVFLGSNQSFAKIAGVNKPENLLGKTDFDLHWYELAAGFYATEQQIMKTNTPRHYLEEFTQPNGNLGWADIRKIPLHDDTGQVVGILGTAEDITERKVAEQNLTASEQRYRILFEESPISLWEEDFSAVKRELDKLRAAGITNFNAYFQAHPEVVAQYVSLVKILNVNKATLALYRASSKEQLLTNLQKILPTDAIIDFGAELLALVAGKSEFFLETTNFTLASEKKHVILKLSTVSTTQDTLIVLVSIIDITERRQMEQWLQEYNHRLAQEVAVRTQELRASEERFELAMRGANDGIWDWNLETNAIYYSPRWKHILEYEEHEIAPHLEEYTSRLHPDDIEPVQTLITAYLNKKIDHYEIIHRLKPKHGDYRWILSRGAAVWNNDGKATRLVGTIVDITTQKQIENDLQLAKENAELANRAKSTFLANMSHELRTPLNGILGYTQILNRDKTLTEKQREGINIIQRSGDYLLTLINDILDLSKIEAGKVEIYPIDFRFDEFIQGIIDLFQMRAQQKKITFDYQPLSILPIGIHGDEKRLRQILINLLGNAVKFTEKGLVTLKINYLHQQMQFEVEDTGIGIATDHLEKIFLPFQQAGDNHYQAQGTGLGLTITQKLVEMMGGKLEVTSTLGKGSQFQFALNLPEVTALVQLQKEEQPLIIGFEGRQQTILVVDDKWENRSVVINLLTPLGFRVIEAENGKEGLAQMIKEKPNLILTDLVMPIMDGFEFARIIRKHQDFKNIPLIAVSASVFDYQQQESIAAGCNDFLPKPIRAEELLDKLKTRLGLIWIYEDANINLADKTEVIEINSNDDHETLLAVPSATQAKQLFELAMMGDIGGILEELDRLEQMNSQLLPFTKKIRQLAKAFEEEKICRLLEQFR